MLLAAIMATTFLNLPLELRERIYAYALQDTVITLTANMVDIDAVRLLDGTIDSITYNAETPSQEEVKAQLMKQ